MTWLLRSTLSAILVVAGVTLAPRTLADTAIATVISVDGEVTAGPSRDDRRSLEAGSPVFEGDRIASGEAGGAVIRLDAGPRITMGPVTDFRIRPHPATADQPDSSLLDVYEGVVRFDLRGTLDHVIGLQTNTAVVKGQAAVWTLVAEEGDTAVWVHNGRIRVQGYEPGRDTVGAAQVVAQGQIVHIPAYQPAPAPREISQADLNSILRRMGGRFN